MKENITLVGEHCFGCTACHHICPEQCITMEEDEKGFLYPQVDESSCTECGLCLQVCPYLQEQRPEPASLVYAVKHKETDTRLQSASGGAFTAISDHILAQRGIIYGAAFAKGMRVRHMRAVSEEQRNRLRGSKYVQSDLKDVFKEVEHDLHNEKHVLFSGTPCQVTGLHNYLQKEYEKLLTVDLLCYGVPSPKLFADYVALVEKQAGKPLVGCTFRDTSRGWRNLALKLDFGSDSITLDAPASSFYALFLKDIILRPSCHECKFSTFNRSGDITIGDFWGIEDTLPEFEDEKGVSLLLANTNKGKRVFEGIAKHLAYEKSSRNACLQPALIRPTSPSKDSDAFWREYAEHGYLYVANKYSGV